MLLRYFIKVDGDFKIPLSGSQYTISVSGVVKSEDGSVIPWTDIQGKPHVKLNWYRGNGYYDVSKIVVMTYKNPTLMLSQWEEVSISYLDGDVRNLHASNLIYRLGNIVEMIDGEEFRIIPGYTRYVISQSGKLMNRLNHQFSRGYGGGSYYTFYIRPDIGKAANTGRHRLLCLAWKPYPDNVDELDVNHLNGNPGDDDLDNLEWAPRSVNNSHAVATGLRTDNLPIVVRNIITGEELTFMSIAETARHLGVCGQTVSNRTKSDGKKLYDNAYLFKLLSSKTEWLDDKPVTHIDKSPGARRFVLVKDTSDDSISEYPSVNAASVATGVSRPTITHHCETDDDSSVKGFSFQYKFKPSTWK